MALTDNTPIEKNSANETHQKSLEKKEKPLTKVIIRRLPPTIEQESFLEQISPIPDYDYIYSVKGDFSLGENAFSRVYINFINPEDVFNFKERFDNYVFLDNKGHEYPAVVEFAAFQKIPKKRKVKSDPKCGSIETDPVYLDFVESLKHQPQQEEKPEYSYQLTSENKTDITTPLLEYVKQRRIERQRIKEERREEKKRKEFERKKKEDDRRKRYEERSPIKTVAIKPNTPKPATNISEKSKDEEVKNKEAEKFDVPEKPTNLLSDKAGCSGSFKNKERKNDERKGFTTKPKYPLKPEKKDYYDKKTDYKRRDEYKPKNYEEYKKDDSKYVKKVKKYSERREERKNIVKQTENNSAQEKCENESASASSADTEQKKLSPDKTDISGKLDEEKTHSEPTVQNKSIVESENDAHNETNRMKENDPRTQRRIRNKDRPTMAIYQPGMLSKRKQNDADTDPKSSCTVSKEAT